MKGFAYDNFILSTAKECDFFSFFNCYFLADINYSFKLKCVLILYADIKYHFKKFEKSNKRFINISKLYNFRHVDVRSVIKRVFVVFKREFRIFDRLKKTYSIKIQMKLVFELTVVHNFIIKHENSLNEFFNEVLSISYEKTNMKLIIRASIENTRERDSSEIIKKK